MRISGRFFSMVFILFGLILLVKPVMSYIVIIQPDPIAGKDAWISSANETNGNGTTMYVGRSPTGLKQEY